VQSVRASLLVLVDEAIPADIGDSTRELVGSSLEQFFEELVHIRFLLTVGRWSCSINQRLSLLNEVAQARNGGHEG
jgi:hypothetical protein